MSLRFTFRRGLLRAALALSVVPLLAACKGGPDFMGSDISGTKLGQGVALTDMNGQPRTMADYGGKVVVAFFGFTQCPDVCPSALLEMAQVMQALGPDAQRVQVLLITVDPERDTQEVLREYVTAFDPRFVGLTGTPEEIKRAAESFKAYYAKSPRPDGDYSMDHTAAFYLLDTEGQARVLASNNAGVEALVHDIRLLLEG